MYIIFYKDKVKQFEHRSPLESRISKAYKCDPASYVGVVPFLPFLPFVSEKVPVRPNDQMLF